MNTMGYWKEMCILFMYLLFQKLLLAKKTNSISVSLWLEKIIDLKFTIQSKIIIE